MKFKKFNSVFVISLLTLIMSSCSSNKLSKKEKNLIDKKFNQPVDVQIKPGEVQKVIIPKLEGAKLMCGKRTIPLTSVNGKVFGFISESYFTEFTPYKCFYQIKGESFAALNVEVKKKEFRKERLYVDKKRVWLSKKNQERVKREQKMLNAIYKNSIGSPLFRVPFKQPLKSKVTSYYGTRRIFNGNKKSQHLGIDYRAAVGVDIVSANRGKVVLSGNLFYTGNTVILDHGMGIFTVYGHLSKTLVNVGDIVAQSDLVGKSGATGRVSGPHLHWGVKVHGNWIDGNSLVDETQNIEELVKFAKYDAKSN